MACRTDPALQLLVHTTEALGQLFGPDDQCPAKVGTTEHVRTFAGDGLPLAAWDNHAQGRGGCGEPFVWQRVRRRYRSKAFPHPTVADNPCPLLRVVDIELGVGWCAKTGTDKRGPTWAEYEEEAQVSMDVAWRLEEALCLAAHKITADDANRLVGTDTLVPYGPEGTVIAWSGVLYATY